MSKHIINTGATSQRFYIYLQDSTTGQGKTSVTAMTCHYLRDSVTGNTPASVTLTIGAVIATTGTAYPSWTSGQVREIGYMPGIYLVDLPDAIFANTARNAVVQIIPTTGTAWLPVNLEFTLAGVNIYDQVRMGMTAIPNVAQGTLGSLPTANATGQVTVVTNNDKTGYSLTTAPPTAAAISTQVWSETTRVLTAGTNIVLVKGTGITGFNDITAANVWDTNVSGYTTAGFAGTYQKNLDAAITTRMATFTYTTPPTAASISTQVWTEAIPGSFGAGSAGAKLNTASLAGDPWSTALPGSYALGTAGYIVGTNLNATISSRMATFTYTAPLTAGDTASAVWNALLSSYTTANTFGDKVLRAKSTSPSNEAFITGSNHIAADVHELQPAVITASDFSAGAIDANALAADAAAEIADATWNLDISGHASPTAGFACYQGLIEASLSKSFAESMTLPAYKQSMADYLLGRNIAGGSDTGRLVKEALYALRNKSEIVGSTLNVYNNVDGAIAWTASVSSSGSAVPVTGIDPA